MSNTTATALEVVETYFAAWRAHDWAALRGILADDVTFRGPLATLDNADDCVQGLEGMSKIMTDIEVRHRWVDGDDVITWFDLHTKVADPAPTANWSHIENGKVTSINVTFDARPLAPPSEG